MTKVKEHKPYFRFLMIVFFIGFILRLGLALVQPDKVFWTDEEDYLLLAERIVNGQGYVNDMGAPTAYRAVGYPILLVALKVIGLDSLLSIRIFQILLSLLTSWILFLLAQELFDRRIAVLAALVSVFYPYFIFLPSTVLSTAWLCFLVVLATFWFHRALKSRSLLLFALSGTAFGMAVLTHPTALVLVGAALLWAVRFIWPDYRKIALALSVFLITYALMVTPWYCRNYSRLHVFNLVTNGGRNLWLGNNPQTTVDAGSNIVRPEELDKGIMAARSEVERDHIYLQEAKKYIRENPGTFVRLTIQKGLAFWRLDPSPTTPGYVKTGILLRLVSVATFGPLFIFALIALVYAAPPIKKYFMLWLYYGLFYTVLHAVFITKVRFRLPLDYFVILLASFAFVTLAFHARVHGLKALVADMAKFNLRLTLPPEQLTFTYLLQPFFSAWASLRAWALQDRKRILWLCIAAALVLRLGFVSLLDPDGFYFSDTRHYDTAAKNLLNGHGFGERYYRTPLYPVVMAGVYAVFGQSFVAMRLFEAVLSVVLCLIVYQLGKIILNPTIGLLMAALAAVFPHFIILPGILYATNLFTLLLAVSIYFLIKTEGAHAGLYAAAAGLAAGLAALTIPAIFFVAPFWLVWLFMRPGKPWSGRIVLVMAFICAYVLVLSPWTMRNYKKYGQLVLVQPLPSKVLPDLTDANAQDAKINAGFKDVADYLRDNPRGTKADRLSVTMRYYLKNPWPALKYAGRELLHFWALYPDRLNTENEQFRTKIHQEDPRMVVRTHRIWPLAKMISILVMLPVFSLALFGVFQVHPFKRGIILLLITIIAMALGYSLIYAEVRYRIPIEPYVLFFTAVGFHAVYIKMKKAR